MRNIINKFTAVVERGFLHIFISMVLMRIIQFGTSVIIVKLLNKETYGSFSYAMNIIGFFLLLNGLGAAPAVLQFCSEKKDPDQKLPYFKYGLRVGISFDIFIALSIIAFVLFFNLPVKGSKEILVYLILVPVLTIIFKLMGTYLRSALRNKEFSYLYLSHSLLYLLGSLIGGYIFKVYGIIAGGYIALILTILVGSKFLFQEMNNIRRVEYPPKKERKEFLKYAAIASLTLSLGQILYLLDILILGLLIKKELVVASYKVATLIPFGLSFIPTAIMTFAYPYFAMNFKDKTKIKNYFYEMQKYLVILNLVISSGLVIFAPLIIKILFGSHYLDSVTPFRILSIGYFFAGSFRIPAGNVLASIRKVKINLYNGLASGTLNILLDIILIYKYGSIGAAIATVSVMIISSLISNTYLFNYFKK